jgi:hypothetical protein
MEKRKQKIRSEFLSAQTFEAVVQLSKSFFMRDMPGASGAHGAAESAPAPQ